MSTNRPSNLPYLDASGSLVIPLDAPRRYRWWQVVKPGEHLGDPQYPAATKAYHEAFAQAWSCAQLGPDEDDDASVDQKPP